MREEGQKVVSVVAPQDLDCNKAMTDLDPATTHLAQARLAAYSCR